ncbi:MAG: type II toxin-antitoxin system VapC family toxin [Dehalococcoidia bacterium]|nr:type II toxin-antitoxin system VapC family toxin [Dehalococcoidia bacterium]
MTQPSYLVDTDWIIHYLNGHRKIVSKVKSLKKDGLSISIISLAELYEGVYYSTASVDNERALSDFLSEVSIVEINEEVCKIFGKERGRLRREGKTISDFDLLIAATCLLWGLTLLTNNRRHFETIKQLKLISPL